MDVKLHMLTVLGLGAALSALCYGISWIIAARRLPMRGPVATCDSAPRR